VPSRPDRFDSGGGPSEEEVPLVRFALGPAMSAEAHLFGIVGAEFVTEELPIWSTPRLWLSVHDW